MMLKLSIAVVMVGFCFLMFCALTRNSANAAEGRKPNLHCGRRWRQGRTFGGCRSMSGRLVPNAPWKAATTSRPA